MVYLGEGGVLFLEILDLALVQEIAPYAVHAVPVPEKGQTLLGFIFRILIVILPQLVNPVGKLALLPVLTTSISHEVFTQFILKFPVALLLLLRKLPIEA